MSTNLSRPRRLARQEIDVATSSARLRHISGLAGQSTVYAEKLAQATAYLADPTAPVPPYVAADVTVTGCTALAAAQAIVSAAAAFHAGPGPAIEVLRRSAKISLSSAKTAEEIEQILASTLLALQST